MCAFETLKTQRRRNVNPAIRITNNNIYLNQFINTTVKGNHVDIQVDKSSNQVRLIIKDKETTTSHRVTRLKSSAVISFRGIMEILGLKQPITINVQVSGNQITGTYKAISVEDYKEYRRAKAKIKR